MKPRTGGLGGETQGLGVRRLMLVTPALNIVVVAGKLIAGLIACSLNIISYPRRTIAVGLKELFVIHSPDQTENDNSSKIYGN
jgi:hypothetical protein